MAYNFRIDMLSVCSVMNKGAFIVIWHVTEATQLFRVFALEMRLLESVAVVTRAQLTNSILTTNELCILTMQLCI